MDYYPLSDLLYRSVALADDDKDIQEVYDTDAYGNTLVFSDPDPADGWFGDDAETTDDPTCTFVFTGRRFDPETDIYFYRARYYHADLGRFVSKDPIGYVEIASLYAYVMNHPIGSVDPLGLQHLGKSNLDLLSTYTEQAIRDGYSPKPSQLYPDKTAERKAKAAWYCGTGITNEGLTSCMGDIAISLITESLMAGLPIPEVIKKAKDLYDVGKGVYEEQLKDRLKDFQVIKKEIRGPGRCYCQLLIWYEKASGTFEGSIHGLVGEKVNRFGKCTKCCEPEPFTYTFRGSVKMREDLLGGEHVSGVDFRWG